MFIANDINDKLISVKDSYFNIDYICPKCGEIVRRKVGHTRNINGEPTHIRTHFFHIGSDCGFSKNNLHDKLIAVNEYLSRYPGIYEIVGSKIYIYNKNERILVTNNRNDIRNIECGILYITKAQPGIFRLSIPEIRLAKIQGCTLFSIVDGKLVALSVDEFDLNECEGLKTQLCELSIEYYHDIIVRDELLIQNAELVPWIRPVISNNIEQEYDMLDYHKKYDKPLVYGQYLYSVNNQFILKTNLGLIRVWSEHNKHIHNSILYGEYIKFEYNGKKPVKDWGWARSKYGKYYPKNYTKMKDDEIFYKGK